MSSLPGIAELPIAIVGMACRLPGARNLAQFWELIVGGRSPIGELPPERFDQELYYDPRQGLPAKSYTKIGAVLEDREFNAAECPLPAELVRSADRTHLLMCETAAAACRHAGLDPFRLPLRNTGVYVGHAQGSTLAGDYIYRGCVEEAAQLLAELPALAGLSAADRQAVVREMIAQIQRELPERRPGGPDLATHMVAGLISRAFGLSGPYLALNAACASSPQALLLAARALQLGRIEMAIVGGASDCKSDTLTLFSAAQSMSATGSRPFDAEADGLVCSEGYVALVLKTLPRALADGDPIQAVIAGLGIASDGHGKSLWAPRKEGQIEAMRRAYRGGLDPATLQYIEAHATSTALGDATELTALGEVLTGVKLGGRKIALGSVKANLGHTLECAGLTSVVKTVLCLQHRTLPPAINIRELNRKIDWQSAPFYVPRAAEPWPEPAAGQPRRAAVNSFGIGGLNMHLVLEETPGASGAAAQRAAAPAEGTRPAPRSPDDEAVAVVGMGCILPGAQGAAALARLLEEGRDVKTEATSDRWPAEKIEAARRQGLCTRGGFITDFAYDWRRHKVPPKQVAQADPMQFMLLEAADQAVKHAGYDRRPLDKRRTGVLVGTEFGGDFATQLQVGLRLPHMQHVLSRLLPRYGLGAEQFALVNEAFSQAVLAKWPALVDETGSFSTSTLASRITKTLDLMGGAAAVDSGDTSAMTALAGSIDLLLAGDCDLMLYAAGQRRMGWPTYEALATAGVLAKGDNPPAPFDARAQGLVPGEGVGVLLLKRLADARRDGDTIHAIIRGIAAGHAAHPEEASRLAISRALAAAGVDPQDIALLETDGLGLPADDVQLVAAARRTLAAAPRSQPLVVASAVGQFGHTSGASGMVSLLKAALEVESGRAAPLVGLSQPGAGLGDSRVKVPAMGQPLALPPGTPDGRRLAVVTSHGKGLAYAAIVERGQRVPMPAAAAIQTPEKIAVKSPAVRTPVLHPAAAAERPTRVEAKSLETSLGNGGALTTGPVRIVRLGGAHYDELSAAMQAAADRSAAVFVEAERPFAAEARFRLAVVADSSAALAEKLRLAVRQMANPAARPVLEQQGIFYRTAAEERPRVVFLFAGQGSQYAGMCRELVETSPAAREMVARLDAALRGLGEPTFAELAWSGGDKLGSDAWHTQMAMLAADLVQFAALGERGIAPDAVAGHSFGELAALTAAGAWSLEDAVRIVRARARGSASGGDRGGLVATTAPRERVEELAAQVGQPIYVANHNAPDQTVVGGSRGALEALVPLLAQHAYKAQRLPVPAAFHTPLMYGAAGPLEAELRRAAIGPPRVPVLSSVTNRYVAEPAEIRENLARQLTRPVEWVALVRRLADEGPAVLVEVGPQQALTKLARRILQDREVAGIVASDNPARPGVEPLLHVQALLECLGVPLADRPAMARVASLSSAPAKTCRKPGKVVHFDATEIRREKMRQAATKADSPSAERPIAPGAEDPPATRAEPVPAAPVELVPAAMPPSAAAPVPAPSSAPAAAAAPVRSSVDPAQLESFLINFVVEQTGYPPEVVELDADLEADLGIDSIKKAQMLGELQEYFQLDLKAAEGLTLDDFPTLRHVVDFLRGGSATQPPPPEPNLAAPAAAAAEKTEPPAASAWPAAPAPDQVSAPAPARVSAPAAAVRPSVDPAQLESFLVNFVVEQTGYPPDVVDLDADLEADLGIDSIKKAQMLGELQEYFQLDLKAAEGLTLDDFPTLRHVVNFLRGGAPVPAARAGDASAAASAPMPAAVARAEAPPVAEAPITVSPAPAAAVRSSIDPAQLESFLVNFVVEQTGYPPDVVDLDADLEADLGIDSIKKAQMLGELQEYFQLDLKAAEGLTLDDFPTLRHVVNFLRGDRTGEGRPETAEAAAASAASPAESDTTSDGEPAGALVLRLAGSPYEQGLAHGRALREPIRRILRRYADLADQDLDELPLAAYREQPERLFSAQELDEMRGIAAGAGVPTASIVAHNLALLAEMGVGATQLVLPGAEATLHAIEDPLPLAAGLREELLPVVLVRETPGRLAHAVCTFAGLVYGTSGINAAGLAMSAASQGRLSGGARSGRMPGLLVGEILARASDGESAAEVARLSGALCDYSACVTDAASGQAWCLECRGGEVALSEAVSPLLVAGIERLLAGERLAAPPGGRWEAAAVRELLQQQAGNGALGHARGVTMLAERGAAPLHVIMRPGQGQLWLAGLGPSNGELLEVRVEELAPRAPFCDGAAGERLKKKYVEPPVPGLNEGAVCRRYQMRMVRWPLPAETPPAPRWKGPAVLLGDNAVARVLAAQIEASGGRAHFLPSDGPLEASLAALDQVWSAGPAPHLFLLTGSDDAALDPRDQAGWEQRRREAIERPFFVCQRWVQLARQSGVLDRGSVVATTSLGGDFGFAQRPASAEGGWLTGLIKSLFIEIVRVGNHPGLLVKAIDAPRQEPPAELAASICRELAGGTDDFEVAFVRGKRYLQNAYERAVEPLASADIRPGAVWVATGGARGITAASALALGQRYGLRLHLIGGTAIEPIEREWLALDERGLAELKTRVMRAAYERGEQPQAAWGRIEKSLEMTRWLRAFEEAGVWARYHACNVGDRAALAAVLEAVRRESGPIEGVLHGAGVDIPRRFEKKELAGVRATLAAKIDGAANLMALTWNDPVRHFIGYGSVSGRLGSNGQTDYAAASDMLAKLVAWYSHLRPECRAIAFHWAPWDEIGMAARPENRVALKVKDAPKLLPKDEGLSHLVRELYDGGRAREVLIIDPTYHKLFYNKGEPPAESEPEAAPLPAGQMQTQPPVPAPSPAAAQRAAQVAEPALTERHVLRLVEAPPAHSAEPGRIAGTTLIVGENAAAIALESRLVAAGSRVLRIGTAGTRDEALARLEAAWRESPAETLILASSADDAAEHIFEPGQWRERLEQGVLAPYFLLQRWRQLWLGWEGRSRATVLGLVRLGGDFGLGGNCAAPEGGAIAGMLKSLKIEDLRSQANALRVRVVDVRSDEAPSSVAEYLHRELREAGDEIEVSWLSGRRLALRPLAETAPPGEAEIPRGGVWVVTGGGCGISAATALALGQRYGLKLHLIGRTPLAAPDAAWRHKSPAELEALKAEILRRPAMNGQSPQAAWERMRRQMEIDANLRRFCEAGVAATYHACDVGDREGLSRVLDEIRRTDGPITGILHGAGTNNPARLERQRREVVETMVRAKVGGAWNLMLLTRQDPVRFFLGFGSVTGRFGGNGMTDYAATNDMLARLVGWYRRERPECAAVCFDWESWSDVGMAVAPRHVMAGIQAKLEFMPPREGVEHIVRELAAGAPEAEVVLTREAFIRERYPHVQIARPAELAPLGLPLISAMRRTAEGCIAEALLDPVTDPFLREHRLRNRPLMPAVVGLELLAEAAYAAADQQGEVNALADVQIVDGLSFPTDQPQQPRVTAVRAGQGRYAARVTCDFFNRQGKLIQAERPYLQGQVELAARRERLEASCPPPRGRWHAFHYEDGHVMYHGSALRGVQQTTFDEREGWARLVALPLQGLAGRRPAGGWIVPSTLLDAAFYACGIHVWYHAGGAVSLPRAIDRLRLGRPLRSHEQCLVHFVCRELSGQAAAYDFTISGEDGEPIAQVAGYRKVLLTDRRAGT